MSLPDLAAGIVILVGLAGIVIPVLPGSLLIAVAVIAWAAEVGGSVAWGVAIAATVIVVIGNVVKYALPGKQLKATVPTSTLLAGAAGAILGFFVIPVVGALAGFPVGVYVAERRRVGAEGAWPSTKAALRAIGVSILIEFAAGVLAASVFVAGAVAT